jgi:hypothetical protein
MPPFQYLGQVIDKHLIHPQKVVIRKDNLKTLNDLLKTVGRYQLAQILSKTYH